MARTAKSTGKTNGKQRTDVKRINLALQGGGAHGAFAWGVIDRLLEDGNIEIEGIVGTSARCSRPGSTRC
jgi:NTE family protein